MHNKEEGKRKVDKKILPVESLFGKFGMFDASQIIHGTIPTKIQGDLTQKDYELIAQCTNSEDLKKLAQEKMEELKKAE